MSEGKRYHHIDCKVAHNRKKDTKPQSCISALSRLLSFEFQASCFGPFQRFASWAWYLMTIVVIRVGLVVKNVISMDVGRGGLHFVLLGCGLLRDLVLCARGMGR